MNENDENADSFYTFDLSPSSEAFAWLAMVVLAVLLFELTADPALAVGLGCLKFGAHDLRIARWLRRTDPDRRRGRACSWFYVALAFTRIGFMALLILIVLFAVTGPGIPQGQIARQLVSAFFVIFACLVGGALASWAAVGSALRRGVCVWMDATTGVALRAGVWPPFLADRFRRANLGPELIVGYALISGWLALLALLFGVFGGLLGMSIADVLLSLVIGTPGLMFVLPLLAPILFRRIAAASPWDCYPEAPLASVAEL
jgi:hypothetical protein